MPGIIRESREAVQHKLKSVEPYREDGSTEEIYSVHQGFITRDTYVESKLHLISFITEYSIEILSFRCQWH